MGLNIFPQSIFEGFDDKHIIQDVTFANIVINGRKVNTIEQGKMILNQYTKDIVFQ